MIKANDLHLKSLIEVPKESDFPIQNLPFGIFSAKGGSVYPPSGVASGGKTNNLSPRTGVAIGNKVLDFLHISFI